MLKDKHYLYVEDDPQSRTVMKLIMGSVIGTPNLTMFEESSDFLARLEGLPHKPDLILLDIHIKPHSGFEMLQFIRNHPEYQGCYVIALTASVMNEEVQQLKACGFDGAIAKPLNARLLPELLTQVLNGQSVWHIA
ncbi:MAG: response regulator [Anaerolinea sp.]|nr:response regulator [Anaerolinea sp.]MCC6976265.1 response regulator [Anaerolineae bacterium]CAG0955173.1 Polar-differentiation response regulator DivK [Anaerolineae bacterium]